MPSIAVVSIFFLKTIENKNLRSYKNYFHTNLSCKVVKRTSPRARSYLRMKATHWGMFSNRLLGDSK